MNKYSMPYCIEKLITIESLQKTLQKLIQLFVSDLTYDFNSLKIYIQYIVCMAFPCFMYSCTENIVNNSVASRICVLCVICVYCTCKGVILYKVN